MIERNKVNYNELVYFTQKVNEEWEDPAIKGNITDADAKKLLADFVLQKRRNSLLGFSHSSLEIWFVFEQSQFTVEFDAQNKKESFSLTADLATIAQKKLTDFLQLLSKHRPSKTLKRVQKLMRYVVAIGLAIMPLSLLLRQWKLPLLIMSILALAIALTNMWETLETGKFETKGRFQSKVTLYTGPKAFFWSLVSNGIMLLAGLAMLVSLITSQ